MSTEPQGDFIHHLEDPVLGGVVVGEKEIQARIAELGDQIAADYVDRPPLLIGVLKGAFMFMADLARAIRLPVEIDFMAVSSYGASTRSSGVVRIVKDLDIDLAGRHVILVEDIVYTGMTLRYLLAHLAGRGPSSLAVCTLLDKRARRLVDVPVRYTGFELRDEFVVGYGLDYRQRYRNLPFLAKLRPELYRPEAHL